MSISLGKVFEPLVEQRPICVMARGVLEHLFKAARIDALFVRTAETPYTRALLFSSVVDLMGQVVLGVQPSVHAAYQAQAEQLGVSDQAIYDNLHHVEWCVSAALVRDAARQAAPVMGALQAELPPLVPGYRTKMREGHHLAASDHRLAELRRTWAAPWPGQILVVLDQQPMLATEVIRCEDGHAQERALWGQVLPLVGRDDRWIAARNFCPVDFLCGLAACGGGVVRRQHGQLQGTWVGSRTDKSAIATGKVYEQKRRLVNAQGDPVTRRRSTVALHEPTRDGDPEVHVLSHVPVRKASAQKLAEAYGTRWTMETMLHELTETLTCEVKALGYPKAALCGFGLALLAYNAVSVMKAAWRAVHGHAKVQQEISAYDLALEISRTYDGMMVAIPSQQWTIFRILNAQQLADVLKELAANVNLRRDKKHPRSPKKKPTARTAYRSGSHVSTAKILAMRT
jgi:hypothetical protein